jgi:hypothetical protein
MEIPLKQNQRTRKPKGNPRLKIIMLVLIVYFLNFFFLRFFSKLAYKETRGTRPAWAGFKTAEEGRTKIM